MAIRTASDRDDAPEEAHEINVTPFIDVMLVLLIIFIVTAPIVARPIPVQLPQATDRTIDRPEPPPPIELKIDASNQVSWNNSPINTRDRKSVV